MENVIFVLEQALSDTAISGSQLYATCPYCGDSKNHFTVNLDSLIWNCWKCGEGYHGKKTVKNLLKDLNVDKEYFIKKRKAKIIIPAGLKLPRYTLFGKRKGSTLEKRALSYLLIRGLNYERIQSDCMGYGRPIDDVPYRVVIPMSIGGKVAYYQARDFIGNHPKKYLNPKIPRQGVLGNYDYVSGDRCILVEGFFGAIHVGGIALLGRTISPAQVFLLKKKGFKEFIIMLDGWKEGADTRINSLRIAKQLLGIGSVRLAILEKGKQPDDYSQKDIKALTEQASVLGIANSIKLRMGVKN